MAKTPNHEYNVPDEGETDWHQPLNDNFESYDTDIEIRDTDGNRGDYDPKQGAKFYATDTGTVYIGDGSNWNEIASTGMNPSFESIDSAGRFLGVGRSTQVSGSERFGVATGATGTDYGGMYLDTDSADAWPFYGYATDGTPRAYHYYEGDNGRWVLHNHGVALAVQQNGHVGIDTPSPSTTLDVDGAVTARQGFRGAVGASAYLGFDQSIPDGPSTQIQFDSTVADDRGEFDTSNHEFVCSYDGDYRVEAGVGFASSIAPDSVLELSVLVDGSSGVSEIHHVPQNGGHAWESISATKTLKALSEGDAVTAEIRQTTGSSLPLQGSESTTYLTVTQVG